MFARNVAFSLKPNSVPEFTQKFESEVLPLDNIHVHAISLWENREHAEAYDKKAYPQVLEALEKIVVGTPKVRISNVVYSTVNVTTAGATAA